MSKGIENHSGDNNKKDNDKDEEERDRREGFQLLLGGLSIQDVSVDAWDNQSVGSSSHHDSEDDDRCEESLGRGKEPRMPTTPVHHDSPHAPLLKSSCSSSSRPPQHYKPLTGPQHQLETRVMFRQAYTTSRTGTGHGRVERPPVQPVQFLENDKDRGKGLIATRSIPSGETIYTERAAVVTQLPGDPIRACQYCFRSLEPASRAVYQEQDDHEEDEEQQHARAQPNSTNSSHSLPCSHLWPVPEYDFASSNDDSLLLSSQFAKQESHQFLRIDRFQRIHCTHCNSWFCHVHCFKALEQQVGDHCLCRQALNLLIEEPNDPSADPTTTTRTTTPSPLPPVQAPIALATRMFAMAVHHHRTNPPDLAAEESNLDGDNQFWNGLCGSAADVTPLELGYPVVANNDTADNQKIEHDDEDDDKDNHYHQQPPNGTTESARPSYTLQPLYQQLVVLYDLTDQERSTGLSLTLLETLASRAARNGFGFSTQSPFTSYYNAVMRTCRRGTKQHETLLRQVAHAVGGSPTLERGMDRQVQTRVVPQLVALFALTARINHSCNTPSSSSSYIQRPLCDHTEPTSRNNKNNNHNNNTFNREEDDLVNAQVQNQMFVDCHMDLVATRDIATGQEILISYLGPSALRKPTTRRQRDLGAKYLFQCSCSKCSSHT